MIVLYSQCRVNWATNLFVVLYYVIFSLLPLRVWASVLGVPNLWGVPHYVAVHSVTHLDMAQVVCQDIWSIKRCESRYQVASDRSYPFQETRY